MDPDLRAYREKIRQINNACKKVDGRPYLPEKHLMKRRKGELKQGVKELRKDLKKL